MLKRKIVNADNKGWITLNLNQGSYPNQAHVTLKTGMYELLQTNFLQLMNNFNIHPMNKNYPEEKRIKSKLQSKINATFVIFNLKR